jgi:hypothetical protein
MKAKIKEVEGKVLPFPKLMKHPDGSIYLFSRPESGTVVFIPEGDESENYQVGDVCSGVGMTNFKDFNDILELSNR